jgi:hypothetical protein
VDIATVAADEAQARGMDAVAAELHAIRMHAAEIAMSLSRHGKRQR